MYCVKVLIANTVNAGYIMEVISDVSYQTPHPCSVTLFFVEPFQCIELEPQLHILKTNKFYFRRELKYDTQIYPLNIYEWVMSFIFVKSSFAFWVKKDTCFYINSIHLMVDKLTLANWWESFSLMRLPKIVLGEILNSPLKSSASLWTTVKSV